MHTYQLKHPLEKDGIEFVDIVAPTGGSPEFNKACAALAGQFIYSRNKYMESPSGKEKMLEKEPEIIAKAEESKKKSENDDEQDTEDFFEAAKGINQIFPGADKEYLVNITSKFAELYKKNPKILQVGDEHMKQLQFNGLSWYDLSVLATAYCLAFMQG